MSVPAFLSIGGNPITTSGTLALTLSGTALPTANGGTNVTSSGTAGNVLVSNGSDWISAPLSGSSAFAAYASSQITTTSSAVTSGSFTTFDNSPAFTIIPTITGTYKIYSSIALDINGTNPLSVVRIINTSGAATLLAESQGTLNITATGQESCIFIQSTYTLTAGTTYIFDIQGKKVSGTNCILDGSNAPFYMFAEGIGLVTSSPTGSYAQAYFSNSSSWSTTSNNVFADPTNSGGNALTVRQSNNITLTAAGSNLPGITFTPDSSSAVYMITASATVYNSSASAGVGLQLTDGSTVICNGSQWQQASPVTATIGNMTMSGIYVPGTGSPVTVKIQVAAGTGTAYIASGLGNLSVTNSVEWTVLRIA